MKPDFFIVGAPKSGTSSLCVYLDQHPSICMATDKEPDFFGSDLQGKRRATTLEDYLKLFPCSPDLLWGEGSTWYLFSKCAAREIYQHNPQAKIIIMLRNPIDFVYALHSQVVYVADEDITDFEQALHAEPDRKQGRRIPAGCTQPESLLYTEAARFTEQVKQYFDVFGREAVLVIIYDDFKRDTAGVYRQTLQFLQVDPTFQANLQIVNPNKKIRSHLLNTLWRRPPRLVQNVLRSLLPFALRRLIRRRVRSLNMQHEPRNPMPPHVYRRLQQHFAPEVEHLSTLLGRDLRSWTTDTESV
ncbi:MAG: sulfotransferase domain-containing protein [Chloroflexaceae bacterium]|nr:sulfotransferase domain-containing protein [Chloroflexaceae bacterium]